MLLPGSITLWLGAAAVLLPLGTYGVMTVSRERAVQTERVYQARQCNARIDAFGDQINAAAEAKVAAGATAAASISPLEKAAMEARCQTSPFCRSHTP